MTAYRYTTWLIALALAWLCTTPAHAAFDHQAWHILLQTHVRVIDGGQATQVDYAGMLSDRESLNSYLSSLSAVPRDQFEQWPHDDQLAFLINAYNAWTVELILTEYPGLRSIRNIGGLLRSPWRRAFIPLFGEQVSLDNIEHDMIRGWGRYNNPLIHFAVNCASIGCPALRNEAYTGDRLGDQLQEQTDLFLSDRSRNRLDGETLQVSSIFRWYPEDFQRGWLGYDSVGQFLADYADALELTVGQAEQLRQGNLRIRFLDYDWSLNDVL